MVKTRENKFSANFKSAVPYHAQNTIGIPTTYYYEDTTYLLSISFMPIYKITSDLNIKVR